ncbi:MAG: DUF4012 domain-containing protein [Ilumatobacteraceae bacterium]
MRVHPIRARRNDLLIAIGFGAATGLVLALTGTEPSGWFAADLLALVVGSMGVLWASINSPWWIPSGFAGAAAVLAEGPVGLSLGAAAFVLSLACGLTDRGHPVVRSAIRSSAVAGALGALATMRELGAWGVNSIVSMALVVALVTVGLRYRPAIDRRRARLVTATLVAGAFLGTVVFGLAVLMARDDLHAGSDAARAGLDLISDGDDTAAREAFAEASASFRRAERSLDAWWVQPVRFIPILSQHQHAGSELSAAAAATSDLMSEQLLEVDLGALRITDGRIDVDAVRSLADPLRVLSASLDDLESTILSAHSGWLIAPIRDQLDELEADVVRERAVGVRTLAALEIAPEVLGADGERVYFLMFTTPAEARGQGGFMGSWAELTVDDGRISMTAFGYTGELGGRMDDARLSTAPQDWLDRWGRVGFDGRSDGAVAREAWSNITISPVFSSTAQVVADLYPQSGGRPIDGVVSLDVETMASLLDVVGPVDAESVEVTITGDNAARFLLADQYRLDDAASRDVLEDVAVEVLRRIISGGADDPLALGRAMVDPARQGRLLAWSADPDVQSVISDNHLDGRVFRRAPADDDAAVDLAVRVVNSNPSKIDVFLGRDVCVAAVDEFVSVAVTFTNDAPSEGLPDVVIGNGGGRPFGSNRTIATLHSSTPVRTARIDGEPVPISVAIEGGSYAATLTLDLLAESSTTVEFLVSPPDGAADRFDVRGWPQPLVVPETWGAVAEDGTCSADPVPVAWSTTLTTDR